MGNKPKLPTGEFKGIHRRLIMSRLREARVEVYATATWLRIGNLISVAAHYHDTRGPGGTILALVHGRVGGLLYDSATGQAVTAKTILGGRWPAEFQPFDREQEGIAWTEAGITLACAILEKTLTPLMGHEKDRIRHPWREEGRKDFEESSRG